MLGDTRRAQLVVRAFVAGGVLLAAVSLTGCKHSMPMPREELRIVPLAEREYDTGPFRMVRSLTVPGEVWIREAAVSADGSVVAAAMDVLSRPSPCEHAETRLAVAVWDVASGEVIRLIDEGLPEVESWTKVLDLSPDGTLLAIAHSDNAFVEVREIRSNAVVRRVEGYRLHPPMSGSSLDEAGSRILVVRFGHAARSTQSPAPSADGSLHGRRLWVDVTTGEETDAGPHWPWEAGCGDWVANSDSFIVNVADARRLSLELPERGGGFPRSVCFSDGSEFVAQGYTKAPQLFATDMTPAHVRVWDRASGTLVSWYVRPGEIPRPDYAEERVLGFLPNSDLLMVGFGSVLRLLDVRARREVARQVLAADSLSRWRLSADGSTLVVPAHRGVMVYRVESSFAFCR